MSLTIVLSHVYAWPETRRGGERYLHELSAALQDAGHHVTVLTTSPRPRHAKVLGVDVRYLRRRRLLPSRFGELSPEVAFGAQALARVGPRRVDVWHALGTADAAAAALVGSVRSVRSVYTSLGLPRRTSRERRPDRRLHDIVVGRIDHYVCLSEYAGASLRDDYGREPLVLGGGVDTRRFQPAAVRHPTPALLYSGALDEPRKNVALLLEAAALLRREIPELEVWLSGPGDADALVAAAPLEARGAVVALGVGDADALGDLYGRAWATVLPSTDEAFGLVLAESLACGTPIVTLDTGGSAEVVQDGVGFRAAASAGSLASACAQAIALARAPSTVDACRAAAAAHDWRGAIVPRLESAYGARDARS